MQEFVADKLASETNVRLREIEEREETGKEREHALALEEFKIKQPWRSVALFCPYKGQKLKQKRLRLPRVHFT